MSLHVDPQIVSTVAREMTVFTLERLLVGVCHQMPFKFVIITEHYVARLEGALEDLRPYANALRRCHLNLRNLKIQLFSVLTNSHSAVPAEECHSSR